MIATAIAVGVALFSGSFILYIANLVGVTAWSMLFLPRFSSLADVAVRRMRVVPNDLDLNLHMNNARWLLAMDSGRIQWLAQAGFFPKEWATTRPIVGSVSVKYKRELLVGREYELRTRVVHVNDKWLWMQQQFVGPAGHVHAAALVKYTFLSRGKRVPPIDSLRRLGLARDPEPLVEQDMPALVRHGLDAEFALPVESKKAS